MTIETSKGDIEEGLLTKVEGTIDDGQRFGFYREYRLGNETVRRDEGTAFEKRCPFPDPAPGALVEIEEDGVRKHVHPAELSVTRTMVDNANECTWAIEHRRHGSDVVVKRSAHAFLKKAAAFTSAAAGQLR